MKNPEAEELLLLVGIKGTVDRDSSVCFPLGEGHNRHFLKGPAGAWHQDGQQLSRENRQRAKREEMGVLGPLADVRPIAVRGQAGSSRFFKCSCRTYRCLAVLPTKRTQIHALIATETSAASFSWAVASLRSLGVVAT